MNFDEWFKKQFGPRPSKLAVWELKGIMADAAKRYLVHHQEYEDTYAWEQKYTACLYAWNAKDNK